MADNFNPTLGDDCFDGDSLDWGVSYNSGASTSSVDFAQFQRTLAQTDAVGNDPFGFDVDLGTLSHDVVAIQGVGATDLVSTGQPGSQSATRYGTGVTGTQPLDDSDLAAYYRTRNDPGGFDQDLSQLPEPVRDLGTITVTATSQDVSRAFVREALEDLIIDTVSTWKTSSDPGQKAGAVADAIRLLETDGYGEGIDSAFLRGELEAVVNGTPAYLAFVQSRRESLEQDVWNLSTDSNNYGDRSLAANAFLDSLSAEDRAILAGTDAGRALQTWADSVTIAPGGDSNFRRVPFTEDSIRDIVNLEQKSDVARAQSDGGFAQLGRDIGTQGLISQYPSLFYYGDDGTRYFIDGTPAANLTFSNLEQFDQDLAAGRTSLATGPAGVPVSDTGIGARIQAYGANPLELVEDVARLVVPGGGLIIDTAENLAAGQDPFTAVINAAEENVNRVLNFAGAAVDRARDAALDIYDTASDPLGTLADLGGTVVAGIDRAATFVNGVRVSDFAIDSTIASLSDSLDISDRILAAAQTIAQSTIDGLPSGAQQEIGDAYAVATTTGNFGELNAVLAEYNLDRRAIGILFPQISDTAVNELVDQGLVFGRPAEDAALAVTAGSTQVRAGTLRQATALDSTAAAVSNSQNDSDQILAQARVIAENTVDGLSPSVSKEIGDAYALAIETGNFTVLNAILARNNLNRQAINILFPQISNTALNQLVSQGLVFGQPAQDAGQLVANGNTANTAGASTQASTSNIGGTAAAVSNSQNNSAAIAAEALTIARQTAESTSADTQRAIVAAYESAVATGNFTTLNSLLAANNLDRAAVQLLFPQLTQAEINDLVGRGLVFGQPARDAQTAVNNGTAGAGSINISANGVLDNIDGAIEDLDSAIRGGAGVINQVTNIIQTAQAVPGIFVSAAAAAQQAATAVEGLINTITAPPPVPQDLIPGVSAEALLLGNDPFGFDQDLLVNQNATIQLAQQQATLQARYNEPATPDWRVRLQLAPGAQYLYKDPQPGILAPLFATDGVLFPYTPNIETSYAAIYDKYDLTHSNYRGYFYRNSAVNEINLRGTFTAQDTQEANYLLAVIHFFRSVTKMFYGQDDLRGAPPPLVYLSGFGDFQFNDHPCLVANFSYSLPSDVDYIRALAPNNYGTNLLNRRAATSGIALLSESVTRLTQVLPGASSLPTVPDPSSLNQSTNNTISATYVPTKMEINVSLLPTNTRSQVSQQFSLKQFANGSLLKGGFW